MVFEDCGCGGVVEGGGAGGVRSGGHEEGSVGVVVFGFEEDIGGLSWGYEDYIGLEWFCIDCVCFNHGECVVGNAEEEFVVECSID